MNTFKFLITRLEDVVKLTVLSFRDDGSFASCQTRAFVGQPSDEEVISYGVKLLSPSPTEDNPVKTEYSLEDLGLSDSDASLVKDSVENAEVFNISDDPTTSEVEG